MKMTFIFNKGKAVSISRNEVQSSHAELDWTKVSLHDPYERVCVHEEKGWEIRAFARNDPRFGWLASRGLLHMQLWHADYEVSVLTPSQLSEGTFLIDTPGFQTRIGCYKGVRGFVYENFDTVPPCYPKVVHFETWFVRAAEIGVAQRPR